MPAPRIDRLVQFSDVGQFAAKAATAANSLGHRRFLSVSGITNPPSYSKLLAQKLSEHVYRVVDRLYADGICANMIASVVYLSAGCLLGRTASDCLGTGSVFPGFGNL